MLFRHAEFDNFGAVMSVSEDLLCAFELLKVRSFVAPPPIVECLLTIAPPLPPVAFAASGRCSIEEGDGKKSSTAIGAPFESVKRRLSPMSVDLEKDIVLTRQNSQDSRIENQNEKQAAGVASHGRANGPPPKRLRNSTSKSTLQTPCTVGLLRQQRARTGRALSTWPSPLHMHICCPPLLSPLLLVPSGFSPSSHLPLPHDSTTTRLATIL